MAPVVECDGEEDSDRGNKVLKIAVKQLQPLDSDDGGEQQTTAMRIRLVDSLSNSCPASTLSRALRDKQSDDDDPLSASCFAKLRLDKFELAASTEDNDLTSLDWLQDINLLRNISSDEQQISSRSLPANAAVGSSDTDGAQKENSFLPTYDPKRNAGVKPPYSFSVLIFMAIEASPRRRLPVKDIYNWIAEHFPFYRRAPAGWRNSVRHNLSLNKCFRKVEKSLGKGSSWCIDPLFRPNLLQAMRRTPYYPFQQLQMTSVTNQLQQADDDDDDAAVFRPYDDKNVNFETTLNSPSPERFAFVSRRMGHVKQTSADDMDVANTLASLGNARHPTYFSERDRTLHKIRATENLAELVWTPPPHADHVYGYSERLIQEAQLSLKVDSPVDEGYEFGDGDYDSELPVTDDEIDDVAMEVCISPKQRVTTDRRYFPQLLDSDSDDERKRLEGVDALLNLASSSRRANRTKSRKIPRSGPLWAKAMSVQLKRKQKIASKKNRKKKTNKKKRHKV